MPTQVDHVIGLRNQNQGGRGFGFASATRFRSGHLPSGIIPVSRGIPIKGGDDIRSGSDMDTSSDSDSEAYGGRYSVETSPQDGKHGNNFRSLGGEGIRSINGSAPDLRRETSEVYYFNGDLQPNAKTAGQVFQGAGMQKYKLPDDVPSAPPLAGSFSEINQVSEQLRADFSPRPTTSDGSATADIPTTGNGTPLDFPAKRASDAPVRAAGVSLNSLPAKFPTFHASGIDSWNAFISYDACVRLCLHAWASECMEAPIFLENECAVLRDAFGLKHVLLQPEEELLRQRSLELISEGACVKTKKTIGKIKVQVRKVKMVLEPPTGCSLSSLKPPIKKLESFRVRLSSIKSSLSSEWEAYRKLRVTPRTPSNGSLSHQSLAYMHVGTQYIKEVPELVKIGIKALRNHSTDYEMVQETYSCSLRLKSYTEKDIVRMQSGSGETHVFLPDGLGDDLIVEIHDSKGNYCGRTIAQVAEIADGSADKLRWWSIYQEPEHELVGRLQLYINYSTGTEENSHLRYGSVAETVAYDFVLETAMKAQQFQQRNLLLHGSWKWLVTEFASYYGVSDAYTRLRYLSYVMDVATPTADCLDLVHELLFPVVMRGRSKEALSHQENRILGDISDQIGRIIAVVFENYKSLDESSPSGVSDVFTPATGSAAPALIPSLKLYKLLHDILSSEAQLKLCRYFQTAAKKRSKRHLSEIDELGSINNGNTLMDPVTFSAAYQKVRTVCLNIRQEIFTDIQIHNQHILPSFIDLPNLSSSIYSAELNSRLQTFLAACPPSSPLPPVTELVVTTADFQRDLASWNINAVKGGVDAKELFHLYISLWIQEKRLALLELCKPDKVKWSGIQTSGSTTPFVDDIYDRLKETLKEYDVIISHWPVYTIQLESAITDVEKAAVETMEKQYADVLYALKENSVPIKLGLKYVQKIAKGSVSAYSICRELGIFLNSMKRILDVLRPPIEAQIKVWGSCISDDGTAVPGEHLSEVTVMLRAKLRTYLQAVTEKLVENTKLQSATKLKKIIQDAKENVAESDVRSRMQPLKDLLEKVIDQLYTQFDPQVFIIVSRGIWDRMGQDVLRFLAERKENRSWYKASRVAVSVLDDIFASQMQQLLGNALLQKDLEPPGSIMEARSMLS